MNILQARQRANLTREAAAVKLGIAVATLGRWEKGISGISSNAIPAIQELYRLSDAEALGLIREQDTRKQTQREAS